MLNIKPILAVLIAGSAFAGEPVITCEPRELRGLPGEPLQVEVAIETDRAAPATLRIPHIESLHLRTVEKIPIQRTKEGRYIQKRIIIWQGLETASLSLTNLVVNFHGLENVGADFPTIGKENAALTQSVPSIGIVIEAVVPATPPKTPPRPAATPPMEGIQSSSLNNPLLRRGAGTAGWVLHLPEPII